MSDMVCNIGTDIGTEELGHLEMICTIVHQLTCDLSVEEIKKQGFEDYYVDHTTGIYPISASGMPFSASIFQSKGDCITDLIEDMAAEATPLHQQHDEKSPILRHFLLCEYYPTLDRKNIYIHNSIQKSPI